MNIRILKETELDAITKMYEADKVPNVTVIDEIVLNSTENEEMTFLFSSDDPTELLGIHVPSGDLRLTKSGSVLADQIEASLVAHTGKKRRVELAEKIAEGWRIRKFFAGLGGRK